MDYFNGPAGSLIAFTLDFANLFIVLVLKAFNHYGEPRRLLSIM